MGPYIFFAFVLSIILFVSPTFYENSWTLSSILFFLTNSLFCCSSYNNIVFLFHGPNTIFYLSEKMDYNFFFGHASQRVGWWFPDQELNPDPQQWEWGILTTGLPGHSLDCNSFDDNSYIIFIPPSSFLLCLFWPLPSVLDDFLKSTLALVFCSHFREQNQTVNLWLCMLRQQLELDMKQQTGSK